MNYCRVKQIFGAANVPCIGGLGLGGGFEEISHTGVVDSSNERSCCTFGVPSKKIWLNSVSVRSGAEISSQIFQKILNRFQQTRSQVKAYHFIFLY